jgi:surface protein
MVSYLINFNQEIDPATFDSTTIANIGDGGSDALTWQIEDCGDNSNFLITTTDIDGDGTIVPQIDLSTIQDTQGDGLDGDSSVSLELSDAITFVRLNKADISTFQADVLHTNAIDLSWTDSSPSQPNLVINISDQSMPLDCDGGIEISNATTYSMSSLTPDTLYHIRVCTKDASGNLSRGESLTAQTGKPFVSVWRTTASYETITLPLRSGFNYDMIVDWGDGQSSVIDAWDDTDKTHTYDNAGDHTISITGLAEAWYQNNSGDRSKIIQVVELGDLGWTNFREGFRGANNLTSFAGGNTSRVTDMTRMFSYASSIVNPDLSTFDTSQVTNMTSMFLGASSIEKLDLSSFRTPSLLNMYDMFCTMGSLQTVDLSGFDTSNVTNMAELFYNSYSLQSIDISHFDMSSVTTMSSMFYGSGIDVLNARNLDTSGTISITNWLNGASPAIYCNDPDNGGAGIDGTGTIHGETCLSIRTDSDSDGLSDYNELRLGFDKDTDETDTDGDLVPDTYDTDVSGPGIIDSDGDGLSDDLESIIASRIAGYNNDFDDDGLLDSADPNSLAP